MDKNNLIFIGFISCIQQQQNQFRFKFQTMDNYKKYLFDSQFQGTDGSQKIFSFGGGSVAQEHHDLQSLKGEFGNYLENNSNFDNSGQQAEGFDDEFKKDFYRSQFKSLKEKTIAMGFPAPGDLFNPTASEIKLTISSIFAILQQRKQDIDFRNTIHDRIAKIDQEKNQAIQNFERASTGRKQLEQELHNLQNKLKSSEKASKDQISKLVQEKDDLTKQLVKIQNMKSQFEHEIKQRDLNFQKMQEQLRKAQGQKGVQFKNAFDMTQPLEQNGPNLFSANGEYEFSQLVMKRWQEINTQLQQENEVLKENLIRMHNELNEILKIRKEVFIRRRKIDYGDDYNQNVPSELERPEASLIQFKQELFKTPLENNCKEAMTLLQENLQHFKEIMRKFDQQYEIQMQEEDLNLDGDVAELGKIRACKNLSELFKNYNQIFETQDKMICQIIGKSQGLKKLDELNYNINRFQRVMDDKQIEDVRRYLQEQKVYLDESKNEMDQIKRQFQLQLKKKDEEKNLIQSKRQQLEEANEKFKENIRMLQNASKQAIQNLIQNEEFNEKKVLHESQLNEPY